MKQTAANFFITDLKCFKKTDNFLKTFSSSSNTTRELNHKDNKDLTKLTKLNLNTVHSIRATPIKKLS